MNKDSCFKYINIDNIDNTDSWFIDMNKDNTDNPDNTDSWL